MLDASTTERGGWPQSMEVAASGAMTLDGVDLLDLAKEHGTPLWVLSRSTIETNFDRILSVFQNRYPKVEIAYSVKANNTFAVLRLLHLRGAMMDCSAEYEFPLALRAGIPPSNCIINGNGKSDEALRLAAEAGVREVNVDSMDEALRLNRHAGTTGTRVKCLVRVQLTYDRLLAKDPSFRSMLKVGEGKFGSNLRSGQAMEVVDAIIAAPNLDFAGLHHHVGFSGYMAEYTTENEVMHHRECAIELSSFANAIKDRHHIEIERLNLGGGYRAGNLVLLSTPGAGDDVALHPVPTPEQYADAVFGAVESILDFEVSPLIQFEMGAYPLADAGVMLTSVIEVKDAHTNPQRRYVVTDGGMWMFVSRGSMRVGYPIAVADRPLEDPDLEWPVEVCSQVCVFDAVAEEIHLPPVKAGDVLVYLHQGAYTDTQSTQFNAFPRPAIVLVDRGTTSLVKQRETPAQLYDRNQIPLQLAMEKPQPRLMT